MTSLVLLEKNEAVTTSEIIANELKIDHNGLMRLIKRYEKDLNELGIVGFENRKLKGAGRPQNYAILNEPQTYLIIMLMRNIGNVSEFKKKFVGEFMKMKKSLMDATIRQNNHEWIETRKEGKTIRIQETDTIKEFTDYCRSAGSENADTYYKSLTNVPYKALFLMEQKFKDLRNLLTGQQLMVLMTAEQVVTKALKDGMQSEMEYHEIFKMAKNRVETFASVLPKTPVVMLNEIKQLKEVQK